MQATPTHRYYRRRSTSTKEGAQFKKDNQQEHAFFGESSHEPFFKPANSIAQTQSVQRKCADCEKEDKAHRMPEKKEEDKKVMKKEDKKEEKNKVITLQIFHDKTVSERQQIH